MRQAALSPAAPSRNIERMQKLFVDLKSWMNLTLGLSHGLFLGLPVGMTLVLLTTQVARGQSDDAAVAYGSEASFHLGSLLPNQIDGVTEILPTVGFRYALPASFGGVELGYATAHGHGVDYKLLSASLRGDISVTPDMIALFLFGPDIHYFTPIYQTKRVTDYGFHVGAAMEMHLGGRAWLRGDMKFNMNPGIALYIGFGIALRFPDGGGGS